MRALNLAEKVLFTVVVRRLPCNGQVILAADLEDFQ
jgi:hypothetical protein